MEVLLPVSSEQHTQMSSTPTTATAAQGQKGPLSEAHFRAALQSFFRDQPLAVLLLLRFDFGWSRWGALAGSISSLVDLPNAVAIEDGSPGQAELAALLGGDAVLFARASAATMFRPMVREEAFRSVFNFLRWREPAEAQQPARRRQAAGPASETSLLSEARYPALEQLVVAALTDTWSAVRKATARALAQAVGPLPPQLLDRLHETLLQVASGLPRTGGGDGGGGAEAVAAAAAAAAGAPAGVPACLEPTPLFRTKSAGSMPPAIAHAATASAAGVGSPQGAWKAHEGLLLGMSALLRFLCEVQWGLHDRASESAAGAGESGETERAEGAARRVLFCRMCEAVRPTLFEMLAHPQITVREVAQDTFLATLATLPAATEPVPMAAPLAQGAAEGTAQETFLTGGRPLPADEEPSSRQRSPVAPRGGTQAPLSVPAPLSDPASASFAEVIDRLSQVLWATTLTSKLGEAEVVIRRGALIAAGTLS